MSNNSFSIEGRLFKVFSTQQVKDTFRKREFVLEIPDGNHPQIVKFELTQDSCDLLDNFKENDSVRVDFSIKGREWRSPKGEDVFFTSLNAYRIGSIDGNTGASDKNTKQPEGKSNPFVPKEAEESFGDDLPF